MEILFIFIGIIAGIFIVVLYIKFQAQSLMFNEYRSSLSLIETEGAIINYAGFAGWKMPKTHDLQETMSNNGYSVLPVKVIELCKPDLANNILKNRDERVVSNMMPCRISIYEKPDGHTYISKLNNSLLSKIFRGDIPKFMNEADTEMSLIIKKVITNKNLI